MEFIRSLYARLRATFPPNRVVVLLTAPAAALAGVVAVWLAENFPGVSLDETSLTAVFVAGASALVIAAYKWLDGWMQYEGVRMDIDREVILREQKRARRSR